MTYFRIDKLDDYIALIATESVGRDLCCALDIIIRIHGLSCLQISH